MVQIAPTEKNALSARSYLKASFQPFAAIVLRTKRRKEKKGGGIGGVIITKKMLPSCENPKCHNHPLFPKEGYCDNCYRDYLNRRRKEQDEAEAFKPEQQQNVVDNSTR